MLRLLLVDDESGVLSALTRLFKFAPIVVRGQECRPKVNAFTSAQAALDSAREVAYDLVVSDYRMPEMDGVAFLRQMRDAQPDCARVILSGYADLNGLIGAINEARIDRFVAKPWNDFELLSALGQVLEIRALRLENETLADRQRCESGELTPSQLELKRLESQEPGITRVQWDTDGSVVIDVEEINGEFRYRGH